MTDVERRENDQARLQFERLVFFSDAVFAIAITLLVLDLRLPAASRGVVDLEALGPKLFGFMLSFAVIGVYWLHHHHLFGTLSREDSPLRIVNLAFLASIVFLPFPTSVITEYPATANSVVFYALSVSGVGLLATLLSIVARRPGLLRPGESTAAMPRFVGRSLAAPIVFLASAAVATSRPHLAMELWWLVAPAVWTARQAGLWMERRARKRAAKPRRESRPAE